MLRIALLLGLVHGGLAAQAPSSVFMWKVVDETNTVPSVLRGGTSGAFWNPSVLSRATGLAADVQVVQTSQNLGMSGILAGVSRQLPGLDAVRVGVLAGRLQLDDIVRTTTSPRSAGSRIQVHDQFVAAAISVGTGIFSFGSTIRVHDSRLDFIRADGVTLDFGAHWSPTSAVTLGAGTHLRGKALERSANSEFLLGGAYSFDTTRVFDLDVQFHARYGAVITDDTRVEHILSGGATVRSNVLVDLALTHEPGVVRAEWRPTVGVGLQLGRYAVTVVRAAGINDLGATYRVGFDLRSL